jgi:K+-sensing histidine kinase KdpD
MELGNIWLEGRVETAADGHFFAKVSLTWLRGLRLSWSDLMDL